MFLENVYYTKPMVHLRQWKDPCLFHKLFVLVLVSNSSTDVFVFLLAN